MNHDGDYAWYDDEAEADAVARGESVRRFGIALRVILIFGVIVALAVVVVTV